MDLTKHIEGLLLDHLYFKSTVQQRTLSKIQVFGTEGWREVRRMLEKIAGICLDISALAEVSASRYITFRVGRDQGGGGLGRYLYGWGGN